MDGDRSRSGGADGVRPSEDGGGGTSRSADGARSSGMSWGLSLAKAAVIGVGATAAVVRVFSTVTTGSMAAGASSSSSGRGEQQ